MAVVFVVVFLFIVAIKIVVVVLAVVAEVFGRIRCKWGSFNGKLVVEVSHTESNHYQA